MRRSWLALCSGATRESLSLYHVTKHEIQILNPVPAAACTITPGSCSTWPQLLEPPTTQAPALALIWRMQLATSSSRSVALALVAVPPHLSSWCFCVVTPPLLHRSCTTGTWTSRAGARTSNHLALPSPSPFAFLHNLLRYLNSGPGGLAGIFVHERFAAEGAQPPVQPPARRPPHCSCSSARRMVGS
jgi:hypothetical protein